MKCLSPTFGWFLYTALLCVLKVSSVIGEDSGDVFRFLGYSSDGKSYFAEMHPQRTWFEARQYCYEFGMQQASITSNSQVKFLNDQHDDNHFTGWFWTSGRELQSFVWDNDNYSKKPVSSHGLIFDPPSSQNCLLFSPINVLRSTDCSEKAGTLCEWVKY